MWLSSAVYSACAMLKDAVAGKKVEDEIASEEWKCYVCDACADDAKWEEDDFIWQRRKCGPEKNDEAWAVWVAYEIRFDATCKAVL